MKQKNILIECRLHKVEKTIRLTISIVLTGVGLYLIVARILFPSALDPTVDVIIPAIWLIWFMNNVALFVGSPDFVVHNDGLTINFMWGRKLIMWEDIIAVRTDPFQTFLLIKGLPLVNYLIGLGALYPRPAIIVSRFYSNYEIMLEIVRGNTPV